MKAWAWMLGGLTLWGFHFLGVYLIASVADVANFINAYHALGFIEPEATDRGQDDGRRSGLFGRMKKTSAVS